MSSCLPPPSYLSRRAGPVFPAEPILWPAVLPVTPALAARHEGHGRSGPQSRHAAGQAQRPLSASQDVGPRLTNADDLIPRLEQQLRTWLRRLVEAEADELLGTRALNCGAFARAAHLDLQGFVDALAEHIDERVLVASMNGQLELLTEVSDPEDVRDVCSTLLTLIDKTTGGYVETPEDSDDVASIVSGRSKASSAHSAAQRSPTRSRSVMSGRSPKHSRPSSRYSTRHSTRHLSKPLSERVLTRGSSRQDDPNFGSFNCEVEGDPFDALAAVLQFHETDHVSAKREQLDGAMAKRRKSAEACQTLVQDLALRGLSSRQLQEFFESHCGEIALSAEGMDQSMHLTCDADKLQLMCGKFNQVSNLCAGDEGFWQPNTHAVVELLLLPQTHDRGISYAEKANPDGLPFRYLVSHAWTQEFGDLMQSVLRHAHAVPHLLDCAWDWQDMTYWICAFSVNQHTSGLVKQPISVPSVEEGLQGLVKSPGCLGIVLSLDKAAAALERSWCLYEVSLAKEFDSTLMLTSALGPLLNHLGGSEAKDMWLLSMFEHFEHTKVSLSQVWHGSAKERPEFLGRLGKQQDAVRGLLATQALPTLVRRGDGAFVRRALERHADADGVDALGLPALTYAAASKAAAAAVSSAEAKKGRIVNTPAEELLKSAKEPLAQEGWEQVMDLWSCDHRVAERALRQVKQFDKFALQFGKAAQVSELDGKNNFVYAAKAGAYTVRVRGNRKTLEISDTVDEGELVIQPTRASVGVERIRWSACSTPGGELEVMIDHEGNADVYSVRTHFAAEALGDINMTGCRLLRTTREANLLSIFQKTLERATTWQEGRAVLRCLQEFASPSPEVRAAAVRKMAELPGVMRKYVAEVTALLGDADVGVQKAVVEALGRVPLQFDGGVLERIKDSLGEDCLLRQPLQHLQLRLEGTMLQAAVEESSGHALRLLIHAVRWPLGSCNAFLAADAAGKTIAHGMVLHGHPDELFSFADRCPEFINTLRRVDKQGRAPLHAAAQIGDYDTLAVLTDVLGKPPTFLMAQDEFGDTALHIAAAAGHVDFLRRLLRAGFKPSALLAQNRAGQNVAHVAAAAGNVDVLRWLLEEAYFPISGFDALDDWHRSPAHVAVFEDRGEFLTAMLAVGASVYCRMGPMRAEVGSCALVPCRLGHGQEERYRLGRVIYGVDRHGHVKFEYENGLRDRQPVLASSCIFAPTPLAVARLLQAEKAAAARAALEAPWLAALEDYVPVRLEAWLWREAENGSTLAGAMAQAFEENLDGSDGLRELFKEGILSKVNVLSPDSEGRPSLLRAAAGGQLEAVATVQELGNLPGEVAGAVTDSLGWNVLHHAVGRQVEGVEEAMSYLEGLVQLCFASPPSVALANSRDCHGRTPVHLAAASDAVHWLRALAALGAPLDVTMGAAQWEPGAVTLVRIPKLDNATWRLARVLAVFGQPPTRLTVKYLSGIVDERVDIEQCLLAPTPLQVAEALGNGDAAEELRDLLRRASLAGAAEGLADVAVAEPLASPGAVLTRPSSRADSQAPDTSRPPSSLQMRATYRSGQGTNNDRFPLVAACHRAIEQACAASLQQRPPSRAEESRPATPAQRLVPLQGNPSIR
eukprot:TRINITY_DN63428_c0_g1_i2.p1 TRINITY_DN63428_c0_g1~~TRINITY_DN63428_c0_g1_i2.p1  ORF type:complete len:1605 (-),score=429.43 TRINITY_DN63428_c0_g1_i2:74-4888(-)